MYCGVWREKEGTDAKNSFIILTNVRTGGPRWVLPWAPSLIASASEFCWTSSQPMFSLLCGWYWELERKFQSGQRWKALPTSPWWPAWIELDAFSQSCPLPLRYSFLSYFSSKWDDQKPRLWWHLHFKMFSPFCFVVLFVASPCIWVCWSSSHFLGYKASSWPWRDLFSKLFSGLLSLLKHMYHVINLWDAVINWPFWKMVITGQHHFCIAFPSDICTLLNAGGKSSPFISDKIFIWGRLFWNSWQLSTDFDTYFQITQEYLIWSY